MNDFELKIIRKNFNVMRKIHFALMEFDPS